MNLKNIISWTLKLIVALILLQTLYFKFTAHSDSVLIFSALNMEPWGRIGLGVVELITSILILVPKTQIIGMINSLGIILGAIFSHLLVLGVNVANDGGELFLLAIIVFVAATVYLVMHKTEVIGMLKKMKNLKGLFMLAVLVSTSSCAQNKTDSELSKTQKNDEMLKLTDAEWKEKLTEEQYFILREKGTESPFSGEFVFTKEKGIYACAGCGQHLFSDDMKFDSQCGWPSFDKEISGGKIIQTEDNSHGMRRTEIRCAKCGGHLGHIFDDGPTETGKRYCVNSGSLTFEPKNLNSNGAISETITLGGGCFWCIEAIFEELQGVNKVESGYSGGKKVNPTYKEVCTGNSGHAEVVQITFDPKMISLEELLEVFFALHDPTTLNKQGADVGTQYRSVIFYRNDVQKNTSKNVIALLDKNNVFEKPIVTEITAFSTFYKAENYHQEYYDLNKEEPYCKAVIKPKMDKLHKVFEDKIKTK